MRRLLILITVVTMLGTSCRTTRAEPTTPPTSSTTTAPATTTSTEPTPPAAATTSTSTTRVTVTVEGDAGEVSVPAPPSRIVSLSATHTEILYAIGAGPQVAGVDLTSNYPSNTESLPKVDAFAFNVEEVAALQPDLVVLAFDFQGETDQLEALGIPALLLGPPTGLTGMFDQFLALGLATGHLEEAQDLAEDLEADMEEVFTATDGDGSTFFHEVDENLFSATSATFLGDIYTRFGLSNIADGAGDSAFPQLSAEYILTEDPDYIFLGDGGFGVTPATVAARPGWDELTAVQAEQVVALDGELAGRWGPRTIELVRQIGAALEPA